MISANVRPLLERLSRNVVLRRHLPKRFGDSPIYVTPEARLALWRFNIERVEPELFAWIDEFVQPGMRVWDVGANLGLFTFGASHRVGSEGSVIAVEPDPVLVAILQRTRDSHSGRANVSVLSAAASREVGVTALCIAQRGRCANHLADSVDRQQAGGTRDRINVITISLDWLLDHFGPPNVIKIDVEGAEQLVLEGGRRLLTDARPVILCEVAPASAESVSGLLHDAGYRLFDLSSPGRPGITRASWSTLALP